MRMSRTSLAYNQCAPGKHLMEHRRGPEAPEAAHRRSSWMWKELLTRSCDCSRCWTEECGGDLHPALDRDISSFDCKRHVEGKRHSKLATATNDVPKIHTFFTHGHELKTIKAETLFSSFLVEHNLPLAAADHAGPLFRKMFPDSEIAKKYGCARTKTSSVLKTLATSDEEYITKVMRQAPFSLATDGSTDMEDVKMYPIVVRFFDVTLGRVVVMLLKICESRESTGKKIFDLIDAELKKRDIPWRNCVSFAADNAAVMQGLGKGVASFIKEQNPHIFFLGCACHLMHLAAEKASRQLSVKIEDYLVTIYYYLDKSSKRKALLREVQAMCDVEVRKIFKLVSTRWLSLGQCINRLLQQWEPLTVFFDNEVKSHMKKSCPSKPAKRLKPSPSQMSQVPKKPCGTILEPNDKSCISAPLRPKMHTHGPSSSNPAPVFLKKKSTQLPSIMAPSRPKEACSSHAGCVSTHVRHKAPCSAVQVCSATEPGSSFQWTKPSDSPFVSPKEASLSQHLVIPSQKPCTVKSQHGNFDLASFIFKQSEIAKTATIKKRKMKLNKDEEKKELTKPEKVLEFLQNPLSKVYSLFLQRAIPIFEASNLLLQKEEPCVQILLPTLEIQLEKVLLSICKPDVVLTLMSDIRRGTKNIHITEQLPDEELLIGENTRAFIESQKNLDLKSFYHDVRHFFSTAADYMVAKFPFGDELLRHAVVADINVKESTSFSSLRYFVQRFPCLLPKNVTMDNLEDEFRLYQVTSFEEGITSKRIDEAWKDIGQLKRGGSVVFAHLSAVMLGILVFFHSNADCERVFSLVNKNKTQYRSSLSTDMISSLVTRKVSMSARGFVCHTEVFSDALLQKAKSATYNEKLLRQSATN